MRRGVRGLLAVATAATAVAVGVPGIASASDTWTAQPVPLQSGSTQANMTGVSCTSPSNCEAVLSWDQSAPGAEHWNGSTWTPQTMTLGDGEEDYPYAVSCASATNCMAAGAAITNTAALAYTEHWNGTAWSYSPSADNTGELYGVSCPGAKSCMVVGVAFTSDNDQPFAEQWNGKTWTPEPVPPPATYGGSLGSVSCVSATDCIAVGSTGLPGTPQVLADQWNGSTWTQLTLPAPTGITDPQLTGISCVSASNCTAVGDSNISGDGGNGVFAEHWNGSTWTAQNLPLRAGTGFSALTGISCASVKCTAVGRWIPSGKAYKQARPLAEFFNGTTWSTQETAAPVYHQFFTSVSCTSARACTAVGNYVGGPGSPRDKPIAEQETPPTASAPTR